MYVLGKASLRHLQGVHPALVRAVHLAIARTEQDFCILADGGRRSPAQVASNVARKTGIQNSLHLPQADGFSHAVDLVAWDGTKAVYGSTLQETKRLYIPIRNAMLSACDELGILIQHGADWDLDGVLAEPGEWDWPHFQFPKLPAKIAAARLAMQQRRAA